MALVVPHSAVARVHEPERDSYKSHSSRHQTMDIQVKNKKKIKIYLKTYSS